MKTDYIKASTDKLDRNVKAVMMPYEKHIMTIHQHIFILIKYSSFILLACLLFLASVIVLLSSLSEKEALRQGVLIAAAVAVLGTSATVLYVINLAYNQTLLAITNCSVVQILQRGLLFHKVSRLSMADVEDVSSEQKGIIPRLFGFGTLVIQTASEMPNFIFENCPNPVRVTEIILNARDQYNEKNQD